MARWMINCKEHSRLTSERMDHALSFWDLLSVRIHQWVCPPCNQLRHQFDAIRKACRLLPTDSDDTRGIKKDAIVMPEDASQRMKSALKEHLK